MKEIVILVLNNMWVSTFHFWLNKPDIKTVEGMNIKQPYKISV